MPNPVAEEADRGFAESHNDLRNPLRPQPVGAPKRWESSPAKSLLVSERPVPKILAATDFSPASARAVCEAVAIATEYDAELTILHVIDINAQPGRGELGSAEALMDRRWTQGSAQMGQLACSLRGAAAAETLIKEGLPWEEIVEKSRNFDLLFVGEAASRRRWGIFSAHTGKRVFEKAACPVIVVPVKE